MRKKIINRVKELGCSVLYLSDKTGIRYKSLHDFLKNDKGIGFSNLEKLIDCLDLALCEMENIKQ